MTIVDVSRRALGVGVAVFMMAACSGSQGGTVPPAPVAPGFQFAPNAQPTVDCPIVGKTYVRGDAKGKVSMKFQQAYVKVGQYAERFRTQMVYSNWPIDRPFLYRSNKLTTCGLASGKAPLGTIDCCGGSVHADCSQGICTYVLDLEIRYKPPATLPSRKKWKFDLVSFTTEKKMKGFEPLPSIRIVLSR